MPVDLSNPLPLQRLVNATTLGIEAKVSTMLIGLSGWAKTDLIEVIAKELKYFFAKYEVPGTVDSTQIEGLPHFGKTADGQEPYVELVPYKYLRDMYAAPRSVFFVDDFAEAPVDIQARFMKVLHGGKIGDIVFKNTSFVAAANPDNGELMISDALHNRIFQIPWKFPCTEVGMAFINHFPPPKVLTFDKDWERKYLIPREHQIGAYLSTLQDMLQLDTSSVVIDTRGPHPSPRSWRMITRLLAAYDGASFDGKKLHDPELELLILKGCVGEQSATAYISWLDIPNRAKPEEILAKPQLLESMCAMEDISLLYMQLGILGRHVLRDGTAETWNAAWEVLAYVAEKEMKVAAINLVRLLNENRPAKVKKDPAGMRHFSDVLATGSTV